MPNQEPHPVAALAQTLPRIGEDAGPLSPLADTLAEVAEALGFRLVRLFWQGAAGKSRPTLQVMAEPLDGAPMSVEGCAEVSQAFSAYLDAEDLIEQAYQLEVSSPGLDRPLTNLNDFGRWAGFEARLETRVLHEGRKRFRGLLIGLNELGQIGLETPEGEVWLDADALAKAKLMASDALFDAAKKGALPAPIEFDFDALSPSAAQTNP